MNIKRISSIIIILSLFTGLWAQAEDTAVTETTGTNVTAESTETAAADRPENENRGLKGKIYADPEDFNDFLHSVDFVMQLSPGFYINPDADQLIGGPSAPIYQSSIGFNWPNYTFISVQPTITYFNMYNEWINGKVYPIEMENRTASTQAFMIDVPAVLSLYPGLNKVEFSLGVDLLVRFSSLAINVKPGDRTETENLTAEENVKLCNKYFWENAHFFYTKAGICWQRELIGSLKGGPFVNAYFPIGSIINHEGLLGTIVSVGVKISL